MVVPKSTSFWQWNSPLPYLFCSLGTMVILITIALVILVCSYHKQRLSNVNMSTSGTGDDDEEKSSVIPTTSAVAIMMPQIVVIMAGDENPTHLAVPGVSSLPNICTTDDRV
ncbi:hypothetical protein ACH5RR_014174 [Cinchona calisaya]|uniref:Uncharacterized protein n=1 Tax=Cinchona calisaya TaxID=153742 RepID=A0ABD3A4R4_9GENT